MCGACQRSSCPARPRCTAVQNAHASPFEDVWHEVHVGANLRAAACDGDSRRTWAAARLSGTDPLTHHAINSADRNRYCEPQLHAPSSTACAESYARTRRFGQPCRRVFRHARSRLPLQSAIRPIDLASPIAPSCSVEAVSRWNRASRRSTKAAMRNSPPRPPFRRWNCTLVSARDWRSRWRGMAWCRPQQRNPCRAVTRAPRAGRTCGSARSLVS